MLSLSPSLIEDAQSESLSSLDSHVENLGDTPFEGLRRFRAAPGKSVGLVCRWRLLYVIDYQHLDFTLLWL